MSTSGALRFGHVVQLERGKSSNENSSADVEEFCSEDDGDASSLDRCSHRKALFLSNLVTARSQLPINIFRSVR